MKADLFPKAAEICMILESCAKHGVHQLKLGTLEVSFGGPLQTLSQAMPPAAAIPATSLENVTQAQNMEAQTAQDEQELAAREQQIAELMITNPVLAEQLMEEGDLLPTGQGDSEDDGNTD